MRAILLIYLHQHKTNQKGQTMKNSTNCTECHDELATPKEIQFGMCLDCIEEMMEDDE